MIQIHSTTNLIYLRTEHHLHRVQRAVDDSLASCFNILNAPPGVLALECGILPVRFQRPIELACLHAHLTLLTDVRRPAAVIFRAQLQQQGNLIPGTFLAHMHEAISSLGQAQSWGSPPKARQTRRQQTKKNRIRSYRKQLQQVASSEWRRELEQSVPPLHLPPQSSLHHYIQLTYADLQRPNLTQPAPYLRSTSALPFYPLLRLRAQAKSGLRAMLPLDPSLPYQSRTCLRCHPSADAPGAPFLSTHLPIDSASHVATECPSTIIPREQLDSSMDILCSDLGLPPWLSYSPLARASLSLGVSPPGAWRWKPDTRDSWQCRTSPIAALFALGIQQAVAG